MVGGEYVRTREDTQDIRKKYDTQDIKVVVKFKDKEILFVVFGMMIFFSFFFPFLVLGNKIHLGIPCV